MQDAPGKHCAASRLSEKAWKVSRVTPCGSVTQYRSDRAFQHAVRKNLSNSCDMSYDYTRVRLENFFRKGNPMYCARCTARGGPAASAKSLARIMFPLWSHHLPTTTRPSSSVASLTTSTQHRQQRLHDLLGARRTRVPYASGNRASLSTHHRS
jgi:hypothetical protein